MGWRDLFDMVSIVVSYSLCPLAEFLLFCVYTTKPLFNRYYSSYSYLYCIAALTNYNAALKIFINHTKAIFYAFILFLEDWS